MRRHDEQSTRRARLYDAAYRAKLSQADADKWVRDQLNPRPRGECDATPTLFGSFIARDLVARKRAQS